MRSCDPSWYSSCTGACGGGTPGEYSYSKFLIYELFEEYLFYHHIWEGTYNRYSKFHIYDLFEEYLLYHHIWEGMYNRYSKFHIYDLFEEYLFYHFC